VSGKRVRYMLVAVATWRTYTQTHAQAGWKTNHRRKNNQTCRGLLFDTQGEGHDGGHGNHYTKLTGLGEMWEMLPFLFFTISCARGEGERKNNLL